MKDHLDKFISSLTPEELKKHAKLIEETKGRDKEVEGILESSEEGLKKLTSAKTGEVENQRGLLMKINALLREMNTNNPRKVKVNKKVTFTVRKQTDPALLN